MTGSGDSMQEEHEQALAELERSLEMPVLPGEFRLWVEGAVRALQRVRDELPRTRASDRVRIQEIGRADPGLLARTESLDEQERLLARDAEALHADLETLASDGADRADEDAGVGDRLAELIQRGLSLVIDARRQRLAIEVWYGEALNRDRGRAD